MESRSDSIRSKLVQGQQQIHNTIHDLKLPQPFHHHSVAANDRKLEHRRQQLLSLAYLNTFKCHRIVMCDGPRMEKIFNVPHKTQPIQQDVSLMELIKTNQQRLEETRFMENFMCIIPKAKCAPHELTQTHADPHHAHLQELESIRLQNTLSPLCDLYRSRFVRTQMHFPDKRLLQYDCGKLQVLDPLLRQLKQQGHRVLIFTQMSKMLNVLEQFLSMHNHTYFRLDGATKIEKRQYMMERFNADPKIFAFILSTRSGGLGINLTGADTVIFYDSDWNPAMDAQAQDRCHRIGQTKNVTIYRLISEKTIEERILLKANQKKQMNEIVIHSGGFTPDFLKKLDVRDLFGNDANHHDSNQHFHVNEEMENMSSKDVERMLMNAEDESDVMALKQAHQEQSEMDGIDFGEAGQSQSQSNHDHSNNQFASDSLKDGSIEKFALDYVITNLNYSLEDVIEQTREQEIQKAKDWRNQLDQIQMKRVDEEPARERDEPLEASSTFSQSRDDHPSRQHSRQHALITPKKRKASSPPPSSSKKRKI
ncbi:helicase SWR1 [Acrasis kona]|uniref:Helicase SWR1 n=1 Tax=Acrasis kona TaxID=1008807 RepID=A0AAW2ZC50_9EUKA